MPSVTQRNKQGVLVGTFDETRFDLSIPVRGTTVQGLVMMGQGNGLNAATWYPIYALAADLTP